MSYISGSLWNEKNEIRCLLIFKRLQEEGFPRGRQMEFCRQMSRLTGLDPTNISAKVGNFKSVAGVNRPSNASTNTVELYAKFGGRSIPELEALVD
jgi:hypothetical protein